MIRTDMEDVQLNSTKSYVVAVSGGVDSMALLEFARMRLSANSIVVAHMRHNVRSPADSDADGALIAEYCEANSLRLELGEVTDGATSEDELRAQRYEFLESIRLKHGLDQVMTGHHHSDYIESAILSLLRGTSGQGLVSMKRNAQICRPFIDLKKQTILEYAKARNLRWNEDSTNSDLRYLRNYVRVKVVPQMQSEGVYEDFERCVARQELIEQEASELTSIICESLTHDQALAYDRTTFTQLPHTVSSRLLHHILKVQVLKGDFGRSFTEKLVLLIKTARSGLEIDVTGSVALIVEAKTFRFVAKD